MTEKIGTIWSLELHTKAKHEILKRYLSAWFPILAKWSPRIIYLDGFAGPGIYAGGEKGSPVIAIETAVDHILREKFKEIVFVFIEKDPLRARRLARVLKKHFSKLPKNMRYIIHSAEFAPTLKNALDYLESQDAKLAPTFAFLDPFGFSGFSMELIGRMMSYKKCEVLITFMVGFVRRFTDELREPVLNRLYATEEWQKVRNIADPRHRLRFLLNLYEKQLKEVGGAKHVRSFGMFGAHNQPIYYLIYGTKHQAGLEVMKEAMWKVDRRGTYTFSDLTDVNQTYIIDYENSAHWVPMVAEMVHDRFKGETVEEDDVHQFVILDTPFIYRKSILKYLEGECHPPKICSVKGRKRRLCYPEGCLITFTN